MVFFALYVGADLDGLTNLQPGRGCDDPNIAYYLKVRSPPLSPSIGPSLPLDRR
jgi:hypothetical protein